MLCKDLKVVNLNITEDNYEYKALFRLCTDELCMDIDLSMLSENSTVAEIKKAFSLGESFDEIRQIINDKIIEASRIESRIREGEDYNSGTGNKKLEGGLDALNMS